MKKLRKLNLAEVWKLYKLLTPVLESEELEPDYNNLVLLLFEILEPEQIVEVRKLLFKKPPKVSDPLDYVSLIREGLEYNNFAQFVEFVSEIETWQQKKKE